MKTPQILGWLLLAILLASVAVRVLDSQSEAPYTSPPPPEWPVCNHGRLLPETP